MYIIANNVLSKKYNKDEKTIFAYTSFVQLILLRLQFWSMELVLPAHETRFKKGGG